MGQVVLLSKSLDALVIEVRGHVFDAGKAESTCAKYQLQAGWGLLALRKRIEAGEAGHVTWWEYFDTQFTGHIKSRKYAERLMSWAQKDDPEGAIEAERDRVRDAVRESRARRGQLRNGDSNADPSNDNQSSERDEYDIVQHALRLVGRMNEEQRERFNDEYRRI